ncbi:MAG: hypothetical protein WA709_12175 [Stellaceae bacterium]
MNQTTQAAAEGTVRGTGAAKDDHSPASIGDFQSIVHTSKSIHK